MVFDNGVSREQSRVLRIDPRTNRIVESYTDPTFYSSSRGGVDLLPNDNLLITESNQGRVIEITSDGRIVWEFFNPEIVKNRRATICRMARIDPSALPEELRATSRPRH